MRSSCDCSAILHQMHNHSTKSWRKILLMHVFNDKRTASLWEKLLNMSTEPFQQTPPSAMDAITSPTNCFWLNLSPLFLTKSTRSTNLPLLLSARKLKIASWENMWQISCNSWVRTCSAPSLFLSSFRILITWWLVCATTKTLRFLAKSRSVRELL